MGYVLGLGFYLMRCVQGVAVCLVVYGFGCVDLGVVVFVGFLVQFVVRRCGFVGFGGQSQIFFLVIVVSWFEEQRGVEIGCLGSVFQVKFVVGWVGVRV